MQANEAKRIFEFLYDLPVHLQIACHTNQAELSIYVDEELDGLPVAALYPVLHEQVASCEHCRLLYTELKAMLSIERFGTFATPPLSANFDFTYLERLPIPAPSATPSLTRVVNHITWQLANLGQFIVTLSEEFIRSLPPVAQQPTFLKSSGSPLFAVSSPDIADDLRVTITAREKRREPEHYTLTVNAEIPSRGGWPNLSEIMVTLSIAGQLVEVLTTDAHGEVTFSDVRLQDLGQVTVTVDGRQ